MKTRVYIDGYNFYFGCLKGTSYKWLDPVSLIEILLVRSGAPESALDELEVKFLPLKYLNALRRIAAL